MSNNNKIEVPLTDIVNLLTKGDIRLTDLLKKDKQAIRDLLQTENYIAQKCIVLDGRNNKKDIVTFLHRVAYRNKYSYKFWNNVLANCETIKINLK